MSSKKTTEKKKEEKGVEVVYGGLCYTGEGRAGFFIFIKEGDDYRKMAFGKTGVTLFDKVKGAVYEITSVSEKGANFSRFRPTGATCNDMEVKRQIIESEMTYESLYHDKMVTAKLKRYQLSFKTMTVGEIMEKAKHDWRIGSAFKEWVTRHL